MLNVEEEVVGHNEDLDNGAQVAPPIVGLEQMESLLELNAKLYHFDKDGNKWIERGVGVVKMLRNMITCKVRLFMQQAETLRICAYHLVLPHMTVHEHAGNDRSCVWHAFDLFANCELSEELFCIRFATVENCQTFMDIFNGVAAAAESTVTEPS